MHTIRMSRGHVAAILGLVLPVSAVALMMITANVVVNGSFESSAINLTGWSFAPGTASTATGNCSFNAAVAPGTETVTGVAGLPATNGNNIALGSSHQTTVGEYSCTLYQDVAIPAGATTATFSLDVGVIYDGIPSDNAAIFWDFTRPPACPATFPARMPAAWMPTNRSLRVPRWCPKPSR